MDALVENQPFVALVDDDPHSAHLLRRMLVAHGSPDVECYGDADASRLMLAEVLADPTANWPGLIVVDLKAHSGATREFVDAIHPLARQKGVPVVAMVPAHDGEALQPAGAAAMFLRHADIDAYRREAASIVSFWVRLQRPDAVGM